MSAPRPSNHVTEAQEAARKAAFSSTAWPDVPEDLVAYLEASFPPACYDPRRESLEAHLGYGGQVTLVGLLRAVCEAQKAGDEEPEEDDNPFAALGAAVLRGDA
ncbi:hypothetical protein [uncultured Methylobacterium sp.]|uniref:hypothetical protein n=1 Tax=uncultured Methylobacterium sp. TaxID=157278 RepID=UPI0026037FEA|nr:hypothetical protein [uncultured Methylobacterium sp.]